MNEQITRLKDLEDRAKEILNKRKRSPVERWVMPDGYSKEMPSEGGAYWMICAESDHERSPVEIRLENGELIADDLYLGVESLEHFHNGLTDTCWKNAMKA